MITTRLRPGWIALAVCLLVAAGHTQWIEDSINVGAHAVGSLVYSPREDLVYGGVSLSGGFVFAISCDSNVVVARIDAPYALHLALNSTDNKLYSTFGYLESLLVIDCATNSRISAMPLEGATECIWDSVNNQVYVSCGEENKVAVIDCATDSVIDRIRVGQYPNRMRLNPNQHTLYVLNWDGESVSIIDLETNEVIETIRLSGVPEAGCYCAATDKFYCSAGIAVAVIDGAGDSLIKEIPLPYGNLAKSLVAVEAHELVMVGGATAGLDSVFVIDAVGDSVLRTLPVGREPRVQIWSSATDLVYVGNARTDDVSVIAGDGSAVLATIPVGDAPLVFAQVPRHERLYLGHINTGWVYVIRDRVGGICEDGGVWPGPVALLRAWPNPCADRVAIEYNSVSDEASGLAVYAQDGRLIRRLSPGRRTGAVRRFDWDGNDEAGRKVPPGVYAIVACGAGSCRTKVVKLGRSGI